MPAAADEICGAATRNARNVINACMPHAGRAHFQGGDELSWTTFS
jgi:hypothetical protein